MVLGEGMSWVICVWGICVVFLMVVMGEMVKGIEEGNGVREYDWECV